MPRSFRSQRPPNPMPPHRQIFVGGDKRVVNESGTDLLRKAMFDRIATEMRLGQPVPPFAAIIGAKAYEAALQADTPRPADD